MIIGVLSTKTAYRALTTDAHRISLWDDLICQNVAYAGVGDAGGLQPSAADGDIWISLHTAAPGLSGDQTTNEVGYPGYARISAGRNVADPTRMRLVISGSDQLLQMPNTTTFAGNTPTQWSPFPLMTATANTYVVTHVGFGTDSAGAGKLLGYTPLLRAVPLKEDMGFWMGFFTSGLRIY